MFVVVATFASETKTTLLAGFVYFVQSQEKTNNQKLAMWAISPSEQTDAKQTEL